MTSGYFVKHPLTAMFDARMQRLMETEGVKAIGTYWFIREKMGVAPREHFRLSDLHHIRCKGCSYNYMVKIVCTSGLFCTDGTYYWPDELNREDFTDEPCSDCNRTESVRSPKPKATKRAAEERELVPEEPEKKVTIADESERPTGDEISSNYCAATQKFAEKTCGQRDFCSKNEQKKTITKDKVAEMQRKTAENQPNLDAHVRTCEKERKIDRRYSTTSSDVVVDVVVNLSAGRRRKLSGRTKRAGPEHTAMFRALGREPPPRAWCALTPLRPKPPDISPELRRASCRNLPCFQVKPALFSGKTYRVSG